MTDHEPQITVIGPDTRIKGEMSFERTARILGRFEGRVESTGELQIGASAECHAALEASTVIVDGVVEGNVLARERVQLNGSARVTGDVVAEKLIVAEGASFDGRCRIGPEAVADASTPPTSSPEHKPVPKPAAAEVEPPAPEVKTPGKDASAFDWVGKQPQAERASSGWGPRPAADGAA